jgi:hypothetical protein
MLGFGARNASVLAPALADDDDDGDRARSRIRGERLVAPMLVDLEVLSVVRRARDGRTTPSGGLGRMLGPGVAPMRNLREMPMVCASTLGRRTESTVAGGKRRRCASWQSRPSPG